MDNQCRECARLGELCPNCRRRENAGADRVMMQEMRGREMPIAEIRAALLRQLARGVQPRQQGQARRGAALNLDPTRFVPQREANREGGGGGLQGAAMPQQRRRGARRGVPAFFDLFDRPVALQQQGRRGRVLEQAIIGVNQQAMMGGAIIDINRPVAMGAQRAAMGQPRQQQQRAQRWEHRVRVEIPVPLPLGVGVHLQFKERALEIRVVELDPDDGGFDDHGHDLPRALTSAELNRLPKVSMTREGLEMNPVCTICYVELCRGEWVVGLNCRHCYHRNCIADWLHDTCPLCRGRVVPAEWPANTYDSNSGGEEEESAEE